MTEQMILEKPSGSPREQELREIERILAEGTFQEYKLQRDRIQFFTGAADFKRRFPILVVFEKIFQNELNQARDNFEGLNPEERGLAESRLPT